MSELSIKAVKILGSKLGALKIDGGGLVDILNPSTPYKLDELENTLNDCILLIGEIRAARSIESTTTELWKPGPV